MQQSSIGRQGLLNQGPNMNININNQTQPQRRPVGLPFPIQEGFQGGQATINDETESDAGSLLYDNNFAGIQATPSLQQPARSENTRGHSLPSTSPVQSASVFSGASMNIPSGGHLRPLQSYNEELVAIDVDLQSLRRKLKQELGDTYETIVAKCVRTFNGTTISEADVLKCSSKLLYYLGDNALKCQNCKQTGNIGTIFRHEERCIVGICSQQNRAARGQTLQAGGPPSEEKSYKADNFQTCSESGYTTALGPPPNQTAQNVHLTPGGSTNGPCLPPSLPNSTEGQGHVNVPMKLLALDRRQEGGLQDRGPTDGATGGALQAGALLSEKVSDNAAILPSGSSNEFDQNRNPGPCLPPSLPNSTEGHVNVQMKLLALDRRQEGGLQDRGPTDGATGGALQAGALLSEETSYKAAILPNEDTRKLLLEMGFKEDKIHRAQQIFKNRNSNMEWTVPDFLEILDNEIHQENVMDPSICGVCHERKAAASQFECRHVVCLDCAPKKYADCCKICNRPVVKVVAIDL